MRPLLLVSSLLVLAGCGVEIDPSDMQFLKKPITTAQPTDGCDVCAALQGQSFLSDQDGECGRTPQGVGMCKWGLTFDSADSVRWRHSDFEEYGTMSCGANGATIEFQTGAQVLVFESSRSCPPAFTMDGMTYRVPESVGE